MEFNYVNVVGKGCEGWLNLFFGDDCIALVNDTKLADRIRATIPEREKVDIKSHNAIHEDFLP